MIIKIVKIYLGLSLVLFWAVWGQFIFRQSLGLAYISQDLQAPSYVVSTNYRVLIYCTCHFQGGSLCFSFSVCWSLQCLISALTHGGRWWTLFLGSLVQSRCGEGGTLQTNHTGVCSLCLSHIGPAPAHGAHSSGSRLLLQNRLRLALGCMHLPGLSHSGSGTQLDLRGADSVGPAFCALPRSEQLGCSASTVGVTYRLSHPCCSVFWVYNWRPFSGG